MSGGSGVLRRKWLALLGLPASADVAMIKDAYRKLALKHHPDVGGDAKVLLSVVQAYEGLTSQGGLSTGGADRGATQGPRPEDDPSVRARWNVRRRMHHGNIPTGFMRRRSSEHKVKSKPAAELENVRER